MHSENRLQLVAYLWSYACFSVLGLREVRENRIIKIHAVFFIVLSIQDLHKFLSVTQFPAVSSEEFHFKMLS